MWISWNFLDWNAVTSHLHCKLLWSQEVKWSDMLIRKWTIKCVCRTEQKLIECFEPIKRPSNYVSGIFSPSFIFFPQLQLSNFPPYILSCYYDPRSLLVMRQYYRCCTVALNIPWPRIIGILCSNLRPVVYLLTSNGQWQYTGTKQFLSVTLLE
jgi:hypothetical protein